MFLILKGQKPKPICRECRKLHARAQCPKQQRGTQQAAEFLAFAREWSQLARAKAV